MDDLQAYIQRVAKENKIILDPKDPLCALHTILNKFNEDVRELHSNLLQEFVSQLELEYTKNTKESQERMKSLLELTLKTARENANKTYSESAEKTKEEFREILDTKISEIKSIQNQQRFFAVLNIIGIISILVFIAL